MRRYYRDARSGQMMYIDDPGSVYFNGYNQQQQQGMSPEAAQYTDNAKAIGNIYQSGSDGGGYGGFANVAAVIALQHALSNQTGKRREFEGVQTDDIFSTDLQGAHFGTEPWAAYAFDKFGFDTPTSGEKFDAAWENKDYGMAMRRLPAAASHYLDPSSALSYDLLQDKRFGKAGPIIAKIAFPWRWATDLLD